MIIDILADLPTDDLDKIDVSGRSKEWEDMDKEIHLKDFIK